MFGGPVLADFTWTLCKGGRNCQVFNLWRDWRMFQQHQWEISAMEAFLQLKSWSIRHEELDLITKDGVANEGHKATINFYHHNHNHNHNR